MKTAADPFEALTAAVGRPMRRTTAKPVVMTQMSVTIDAYTILARAIEAGIRRGVSKAHKHTGATPEDVITHCATEAMASLSDVLKF